MKKGGTYLLAVLLLPATVASGSGTPPGLHFIQNNHQWKSSVDFGAKVPGGNIFVKPGGFEIYLLDQDHMDALHDQPRSVSEATGQRTTDEYIDGWYGSITMPGANTNTIAQPFGLESAYYNFFLGRRKSTWAGRVPSFRGIMYPNTYPGIDLKVYSVGRSLKYDYVVSPGSDPSVIAMQFDGVKSLSITDGDLHLTTTLGDLIQKNPVAWQEENGKKKFVRCQYNLHGSSVGFYFPDGYDSCNELVIDPLLIFSTYSGSAADNWGSTATPGEHGDLYSSGVTNEYVGNAFSGKFPATTGAFQVNYGGIYDIAILKYDSTGSNLLYASFLGGSGSESPHSLVINQQSQLLVLGTTSSPDFPTTAAAYDTTYNGGTYVDHVVPYNRGSDIIVARISKDGSNLLGSTLLGGSLNDGLNPNESPLTRNYGDQLRGDIISDTDGSIYISTVTASPDFPAVNSFSTTYKGGETDALLIKMKSDLSDIIWSAFLGGDETDASHTLQLTGSAIYLGGGTTSPDFPVTAGAYQQTLAGGADGWMAEVRKDGSGIVHASYTGTSSFDQVYFLDIGANGNVYVYGQTSGDFPVSPSNVYHNPHSGQFLQEFAPDLSTLVLSTVFGSGITIPNISPTAFLVSDCDNIYMAGWGGLINSALGYWSSSTMGMPITSDAYQKTTSGSDFYFIVLSADATQLLYATYLGGNSSRTHVDGGTCRFDKGGIVYHAVCSGCQAFNGAGKETSDFPTTPGAWSAVNGSLNCNNAAFKFDLATLRARVQSNNIRFTRPGQNTFCVSDTVALVNQSTGGEQYIWTYGDNTGITQTSIDTVYHSFAAPGAYTVKLKVVDSHTCVGIDSAQLVIKVGQVKPSVQGDDNMCFGDSYQLHASGGLETEWRALDDSFTSHEEDPVVEPTDTTSYEVTLSGMYGCSARDTVTLNVVPKVNLSYDLKRITNCFDRPRIQLNLKSSDPSAQYYFDYGDGTGMIPDEIHNYAADGSYTVTAVGTRDGCTYDTTFVVADYTVRIPNVITPEASPGSNDTFMVMLGGDDSHAGLAPYSLGFTVHLTIVNRWGRTVYESSDYRNDWAAQGTATGIYYYTAEIENTATCKGWVHVMK